jgi:phosphodiesterase/alkaline phosphatase D-like protein
MNKLLLNLVILAAVGSLFCSNPVAAQESPTTPKAARVRIAKGPEPEITRDYLTIIRWTTNNPGGSPVHNGIVHYGTDPKNLSQIAKSPIRLNPGHDTTVFRVRMVGLKPGTTYYYIVESEGATGTKDRVTSTVKQFTTDPQGTGR